MVVVIFPAQIGGGGFGRLPIPLVQAEQIVKTSGNLLTSFLIQGGGFKFYQSGNAGSEGLIIKAKLIGPGRFILKNHLEQLRITKRICTVLATSFGFESGLVLNTLEMNANNVEIGFLNMTLSFQKVITGSAMGAFVSSYLLSISHQLFGGSFLSTRKILPMLIGNKQPEKTELQIEDKGDIGIREIANFGFETFTSAIKQIIG